MTKGAKRRVDPLKKKLRKAEMVGFLTSTGAIKEGLASSIYDQGLDRWNKLTEGDETYFLSFKGVGLKTASVLLELSREKKKDFETKEERAQRLDAVKALLDGVPRLRASATNEMVKAGYDSIERIAAAEPGDLVGIKGVGPKLSGVIIERAKEAMAPKPAEEPPVPEQPTEPPAPPVIEEATGLPVEEVPKEEAKQTGPAEQKGFFEKFMDGLKRFFSPAKEEPPKETQKDEAPSEQGPKPAEGEVKESETPSASEAAKPPEGEAPAVTVEAVPEEVPKESEAVIVPEPAPEAPAAEPSTTEPTLEKREEPPAPPVAPAAPEEKTPGFFNKLKAKLFGGKKEEAPAPPKEGEEVKPPVVETVPVGAGQQQPVVAPEDKGCGEASPDKFEDVPGIDCAMAQKLRDSGYMNLEELREAIPEDLMMIEGITKEMAESICAAVRPK